MLENPAPYIPVFRQAGADVIAVHAECGQNIPALLAAIRDSGAKPALALKPGTPADALFPYGDQLYMALVMTVEPGFGGQKLIPEALPKIQEIKSRFPHLLVEVDGGVNRDTAPLCRAAGADILVAGTAVFRSADPAGEIAALRG